METLGIFFIIAFFFAILIYFIPTFIAFHRVHRNRWVIFILNLVFGVTILGWLIILIWALNKIDSPEKGGTKFDRQPHDPSL